MRNNSQSSIVLTSKENNTRISVPSNSSINKKRISRKKQGISQSDCSRSKSRQSFNNQTFQSFYLKCTKTNKRASEQQYSPQPKLRKSQTDLDSCPITPIKKKYNEISMSSPNQTKTKRLPTPVKSRKQLGKTPQKTSFTNFQQNLYITEIQAKLENQKNARKKLNEKLQTKQKQIKQKNEKIYNLQRQASTVKSANKIANKRIEELQKLILEGQNNLHAAHGALNKLRKVIKQNRMNQLNAQIRQLVSKIQLLKSENDKLMQQNTYLLQDLNKISQQNQQLNKRVDLISKYKTESMRENFLMNQIKQFKQKLQQSKSDRQNFLQQQIKNKDETIFDLISQNKTLNIKMHYLQHSKNKQIRQIMEKKDYQIKMVRIRSSQLIQKAKNEVQNEKEKTKMNATSVAQNIFDRKRKRSQVLLQLSPQY